MSDSDSHTSAASGRTATISLLAAIGASVIALGWYFDVSYLTTDTAQYVSVARNFLSGDGFSTDLIYFDVHYRIGGVPVPQTVWPSGFPVLIAAFASLGVDAKVAPFLISLLALALLPLVLRRVVALMGYRPGVSALVGGAWLCIGLNWSLALGGTSEVVFTLSTVAALLALGPVGDGEPGRGRLLAAGAAAAMAVAIRYAGVFFVAGLSGYFLIRFALLRTRRSFIEWLSISVIPILTILVIFGRNLAISGHPTGITGFVTAETSFAATATSLLEAAAKIFGFADGPLAWVFLVLLAGVALIAVMPASPVRGVPVRRLFDGAPELRVPGVAACYLAVAAGGLSWLSLTAAPGYVNERYLLPLLPFLMLWLLHASRCIGPRGSRAMTWAKRAGLGAAVIVVAGQLTVFAREMRWYESDDRYRTMRTALEERIGETTAYDYLRSVVDRGAPLLAPNGQLLGVILDRPVLGLPAPLYTDRIWTAASVRALVEAYDVGYVVYFPPLFEPFSPWHRNRAFFGELENGVYPDWLLPFYNGAAIEILQVRLRE